MVFCEEPDCIRPARKGGKCWAHLKAMQRHGHTKSAKEHLLELALRLGDCDTDDDTAYHVLEREFLAACRRFGMARRGMVSPRRAKDGA